MVSLQRMLQLLVVPGASVQQFVDERMKHGLHQIMREAPLASWVVPRGHSLINKGQDVFETQIGCGFGEAAG